MTQNSYNDSMANIFKPRNSNIYLKASKRKKKLFKAETIEECIKYSMDNLIDYDKDIENEKLIRYLRLRNESKLEYPLKLYKNNLRKHEDESLKISQLDENNNNKAHTEPKNLPQ